MKHQSPNPVHPRLRGELFACHKLSFALFGSSPLTRGTLTEFLWPRLSMRFIPAYAGNSGESKMGWWADSVHPRLRGELSRKHSAPAKGLGSSPLTRGTRGIRHSAGQKQRFIPAYAGNSQQERNTAEAEAVHPRLRGELFWKRVRKRGVSRFIPAYAGNSLKQGIEHLTNSSKDFLSGKYAKNPETVLNHFKNSSLD